VAAVTAFRENKIVMDIFDDSNFSDYEARKMRYAIWWAFYENTAYRHVHTWAVRYKTAHGLYKYIRNIYNPAGRIVDFWVGHLLGGALDPLAGDGLIVPSALPIITENEALRSAIAQVWQWSNWQQKKDTTSLLGSCMGDIGLRVVDDVERQKVYIQVVHPRLIKEVTKDDFGHVKAYVLEEEREDPRNPNRAAVKYNEFVTRSDDGQVHFLTTLNGTPYPWNGIEAEWEVDYGFVPFVHISHIDVGIDWGWSELHKFRSKVHEVDDLTSKLDDQIRKTVDVPWLFTGSKKPATTPTTSGAATSTDRPEPGREELPGLWTPDTNAKAIPLVAPLDILGVSEHINNLLRELERDYPELTVEIVAATGDLSGRALQIARQPTVVKVEQRRVPYDRGVRDIQQMCVAIAGDRDVDDVFAGFGLESFERGDLDHTIGPRPVFDKTEADRAEENKLFWETAAIAVEKTGIALPAYLETQGWTPEQIRDVVRPAQRQAVRNNRAATRNRRAQAVTEEEEPGTSAALETGTEESEEVIA